MRTEVIKADSIAEAAERILDELKEDAATTARSISSRNNVIYFDGWDGLGASAVLQAVAQRLTVDSEALASLHFDHIIHVDFSKWESRRALQRAIVEQLALPGLVMDMFEKQDEEDDFHGVAQSSRSEMPELLSAMYDHIQKLNRRFLIIFQNGSNEEINLSIFGFPLSGYSRNKVLWTFQGRFRLFPRLKVDGAMAITKATDVFLSASHHEKDPHELRSYLVHQEAKKCAPRNQPSKVAEYFLYMWNICCMSYHFRVDYDFNTHCCNYWVCDGIGQHQLREQGEGENIVTGHDGDEVWHAAGALQREMRLDVDYYNHSHHQSLPSHLTTMASMPHCASPSHGVLGLMLIPARNMLQHFSKLAVLKLSHCSFSFASPPFLCCSSLRFLWLDHCQDQGISADEEGDEENMRRCFKRMWVLDVRYTRCDRILSAQMLDFMTQLRELNVIGAQDLDMFQLHGRLPNIRKLRVTKSTVRCSGHHPEQDLFQGMNKMELLDFSGNHNMKGVTKFSEINTSNSCLETVVIIDGCVGLQKFSFRGCAKLKNLLASGLFEDLRILELSGTAVKTVDLSAMTSPSLDELFLNDCQKLCAILWPPESKRKRNLQKLHIDTTLSAASSTPTKDNSTEGSSTTTSITTSSSLSVVHGGRAPSEFDWCVRIRDARLLRSLVPFKQFFNDKLGQVEIYSPVAAFSSGNDNKVASSNSSIKQQYGPVKLDIPTNSFVYGDVEVTFKDHPLLRPSQGDAPTLTQKWPCPRFPFYGNGMCNTYTNIQDHELSTKSVLDGELTMTSIVIPDMICYSVYILHVHDSLSITSIPGPAPTLGSTWYNLEWCRIERCPKLEHAFTAPQLQASGHMVVCNWLTTFWASELPKTRYIWNWTSALVFQFEQQSFGKLKLLHMDLCPRVIHVLPLALQMVSISLGNLETLDIVWCGDLREVFPLYTRDANEQLSATTTVRFQHLKRIHLHELPKLQGICGRWRISAPELETVKIRGCWSLKCLPALGGNTSKKVECDCEKEWWDKLEWDGLDANHHPSLYKATHSRYYKKTQLKGSVLR